MADVILLLMRRITVLAAAALLLLASCAPKEKPAAQIAVEEYVVALMGGDVKVSVGNFTQIDSSTFADEFARREDLFQLAVTQNEKFKRKDVVEKDKKILEDLAALKESMADNLDAVAFRDYSFSLYASNEESKMEYAEAFASVTSDGEVLALTPERKDLHKSTGKAIPGYTEIIKGE